MYKRICIIGGAGFIGSNFIHYILRTYGSAIEILNLDKLTYAGNPENLMDVQSFPNYHFLQADICDGNYIRNALLEFSPDAVVNFAAESHVDRSILYPGIFIETNVKGTEQLLSVCKELWMEKNGTWKQNVRFLQVSTDEVYGSLGKEGAFTETSPIRPRSPYSASKAGADLFCMAYHITFGMPCVVTRCSNNYGPYQYPEKLIPLMLYNAFHGKKLPVYGDGLHIRDWLHVEDHCAAIDLVLQKGRIGEVYNIGGNSEYSNMHVVKKIIEILSGKYSLPIGEDCIQYVEDRKGHDRRYSMCFDKLENELGWKHSISFADGLEATVDWYFQHKDWMERALLRLKNC